MTLQWGTLVAGTETPTGTGITQPARCIIRVDGVAIAAVIKRIPRPQVLAEAFSSLLLAAWQLPVPTPYLIAEQDRIAFASADNGYPNLMQTLGVDRLPPDSPAHNTAVACAATIAASLPSFALAIVADEAIENRDRNLGNILWDGTSEAWIDHQFTLGEGQHMPDRNKLCDIAMIAQKEEATRAAAIAAWTAIDREIPALISDQMGQDTDMSAQAKFVADRLSGLARKILHRFPAPNDLISLA